MRTLAEESPADPTASPTPTPTPTGPVYGHPTPTGPPTSSGPSVVPSIADPGDITTATARFHGTGTIGHRVQVATGGRTVCTATVRSDGTWSCLGTVTSGPQQVFTAVDEQEPLLGTAETPASDVVTPPTVASRGTTTGAVAGDGRPGASVTVSVAGATAQTDAIVGRDGRWVVSLPRTVGDGTVTVSATQTASTAAGYRSDLRSASSASVSLTLDRSVPAAPRITTPRPGVRVSALPIRVSGTGASDAVVTVYVDHAPVCTADVGASGRWTCATRGSIDPGSRVLTAVQRDPAGNTSRASADTRVLVTATAVLPTAQGTPSGTADASSGAGAPAASGSTGGGSGVPGGSGSAADGDGHDVDGPGGVGSGGSSGGAPSPGATAGGPGGIDWSGPAGDWSARTSFDTAVPTIQAVFAWRTVFLATGVAAGFLVLIAAPLAVVAGVVRGRFRAPFAGLLGRNRPRDARSRADDVLPVWLSVGGAITISTLCTLLGAGVSLEARYVRLAIAVAVGSGVLTAAVVVASRWAAGTERHLVGFRVSPWLVLAALVACAATRAGDLSPALVVGTVLVPTARVDLGTGPMRLGSAAVAGTRSATWRAGALLVLAVAGWVVHSLVPRGDTWTSAVSDVAITLCLGGLGALVAALLPAPGSVAASMVTTARGRYAALTVVTVALATAVSSGTTGTHVPPATLVVASVVCTAAAVAALVWSRRTGAPAGG